MAIVVLAGTLDTKGGEYTFVRDKILSLGSVANVILIDVGIHSTHVTIPVGDIVSSQVVAAAGEKYENLKNLKKNEALDVMSRGLAHILLNLHAKRSLHGVMGLGGSCGSTLLTFAFKQLPLGMPKLLVSTVVACGSARSLIGITDMTIMHAVTDFVGHINRINRQIVSNAAVAIASMAVDYAANETQHFVPTRLTTATNHYKPLIVSSMIGLTQPCVLAAEALLMKLGYEVVIFHAIGTGGDVMENLIASGAVDGVLDVTLAEVMHSMVPGGILDSGPDRLETAGRLGIPQVVALGALDILNFGPLSAIPLEYRTRATISVNTKFSSVRTSPEECSRVGKIIAIKLNGSRGPVTVFVPRKGLSHLSEPGNIFDDVVANECLFESIRANIDPKVVCLVERDEHINEPQFAHALVEALHTQLKHKLPKLDDNN